MALHSRTERRQFVAQGGAALLAAAMWLKSAPRAVAAQEATPASATPTRPGASPVPELEALRVRFTAGDSEIVVHLADNPTSHDFVSLLPLTLEFKDFSSMEKISYLPRALTIDGSAGSAPSNGDLIYFVPWGNLGFFYDADRRDASYDDRVIPVGVVESGFELLGDLETGPVRVELLP
ncbi:MAG: hypothetical protein KC442_19140 [Thermomicrobiales bacterium]|nr:hypothetical protein [Thermomicrobiales bacterium]